MTGDNVGTEEEQAAVEKAEAEAQKKFTSGFNKVMGEESTAEAADTTLIIKEPEEIEAEVGAESDEKSKEPPDKGKSEDEPPVEEPIDALSKRLRDMDGKVGGLMTKIDALVTAQAATVKASPSKDQVKAAVKNPAAMKALGEEYEDFKPLVEEVKAIRADMATLSMNDDQVNKLVDARFAAKEQATDMKELTTAHPTWEKDIAESEFTDWALDGGPSWESYNAQKALTNTAPAEAQRTREGWQRDYPKWWEDKGANLFGPVSGNITLLDQYKGKDKSQQDTEAEEKARLDKERRKKRLSKAETPDGTAGSATSGLNDQQAFKSGFDKIMKQRQTG